MLLIQLDCHKTHLTFSHTRYVFDYENLVDNAVNEFLKHLNNGKLLVDSSENKFGWFAKLCDSMSLFDAFKCVSDLQCLHEGVSFDETKKTLIQKTIPDLYEMYILIDAKKTRNLNGYRTSRFI